MFIDSWKCFVKSVESRQVIVLNLDFVVRITAYVQKLILDLVSTLPPMRFTTRDHLRPLDYEDPLLLGTEEYICLNATPFILFSRHKRKASSSYEKMNSLSLDNK